MPATDDVTNGEIVRTLRGLQDEIRALRGEHVRRDLYDAHRTAMEAELTRIATQCRTDTEKLEARLELADSEKAATRRQMWIAAWAAGLSFLGTLIILFVR